MIPGLLLRATVATVLVPGTVVGLVPCLIVRSPLIPSSTGFSIVSAPAILAGTAGLVFLLACVWGFVVQGPYRYTRNPMGIAVMGVLLSEAVLFRSIPVLIYAVIAMACFQLIVILFEEPNLKARFGASYDEYQKAVPRWWIARKPCEGRR